jgi:YVTN family beta-propeller protein
VAVIADGLRAYVTDEDDDEVEVIDVATDTVLAGSGLPIPAGDTPRGIATGGGARTTAPAPTLSPILLLAVAGGLLGLGVQATRRRRSL